MKRFRFRLATLESLRRLRRDAARRDLAEAAATAHRAADAVRRAERDTAAADAARPASPRTTGGELKGLADRQRVARAAADAARVDERKSAACLDRAGEAYRSADRDRRVMARLRERRRRRWLEECEREESGFLSEIHLQRLVARRRDLPEE